ncbi:MAG: clostripain-related cysteine peptidase, partial [Thermoanaerobaculia bacterium]
NLQEMDTANPETLVGFVAFGLQNFPAKHYGLILGDHGGTWMGMLNDETDNEGGMKLAPFIQGLEVLKKAGAPKLDVIGFDMCLMAQVEVMDAISPYASYGVASEELEPGAGYPNHRVLQALTKNPKMSGRDFAQTMVREWGASYAEAGEATVTSSATDLSKVEDLTSAVDALASALAQADGSLQTAAARARAATHYYGGEEGGGDLASFDLGEFAARLAKQPEAAPIKSQLDAVQAAVTAAVIEHKEGAAHVGSTGLAIYFPVGQKIDPDYASLPFVRGQWNEFLAKGFPLGAGAAGQSMAVAISAPDVSVNHPLGAGLPVTAKVRGNPASIRAAIGYRDGDGDGGSTTVSEEEVASPGAWKDGMSFTYTVRPQVRAISDGKNARLVPTTPLTPGSRYVRADASYNSMRGDQKVTTVFDSQTGKLETIFCESEQGVAMPMAVHPVKGEKLVFYQPTISKDKKTQRFRPVPALVSTGRSAKGKAKGGGDDLKLIDSGIPAGAYVLTLTAYDAAGRPAGGADLNFTAGGGSAGGGGGAGGIAVATGLIYPNYGYPAISEDDIDYIDLTQIIPADEYDHFDADWGDYNYMVEYQADDFSTQDLLYLDTVALDATELDFDRQDWSDEFATYSLEHPGDVDGDGTPDATDMDDDNDGTPDAEDLDDDDDGTPDSAEDEDEGDDADAADPDEDHDGTPDDEDADDDNDGAPDAEESDEDHDGTPDDEDADDDNDGIPDDADADDDNDGTPDDADTDDDNGGTSGDAETDDDNDGTSGDAETDDDNDGTSDEDEAAEDGGDEGEDDGEGDGGDEGDGDGGDGGDEGEE